LKSLKLSLYLYNSYAKETINKFQINFQLQFKTNIEIKSSKLSFKFLYNFPMAHTCLYGLLDFTEVRIVFTIDFYEIEFRAIGSI